MCFYGNLGRHFWSQATLGATFTRIFMDFVHSFSKSILSGWDCTPSCNNTAFHNSINIRGNFMVYQDRFVKNLLQLFGHPENSEWFSISSIIIFEVNIVDEQKQTQLVTTFLFFISFHCPQLFYCSPCPTAAPASLNMQIVPTNVAKTLDANVNVTSYYDVINSVYPVTMTTIRLCSILEFSWGHPIKQSPRASPDLCMPLPGVQKRRQGGLKGLKPPP